MITDIAPAYFTGSDIRVRVLSRSLKQNRQCVLGSADNGTGRRGVLLIGAEVCRVVLIPKPEAGQAQRQCWRRPSGAAWTCTASIGTPLTSTSSSRVPSLSLTHTHTHSHTHTHTHTHIHTHTHTHTHMHAHTHTHTHTHTQVEQRGPALRRLEPL